MHPQNLTPHSFCIGKWQKGWLGICTNETETIENCTVLLTTMKLPRCVGQHGENENHYHHRQWRHQCFAIMVSLQADCNDNWNRRLYTDDNKCYSNMYATTCSWLPIVSRASPWSNTDDHRWLGSFAHNTAAGRDSCTLLFSPEF